MMDDFASAEIQTGETTIFVRSRGAGPPALLLHGFPETHLMWRGVAPLLARDFTVVCADLRADGPGQGRFRGARSVPATSSPKRFTNKPPTLHRFFSESGTG